MRACATQFVKNIGVFDSHRVRFRILSSTSGTSPASPASSASAPAKDSNDASDAGDVAHAGEGNEGGKRERISTAKGGERSQGGKGEDLGKKCLKGERGKRSLGGKWKSFSGGTGPKGQWVDRISNGKDLREEREKICGKNALRVLRSFPPFPLRPLQIFSIHPFPPQAFPPPLRASPFSFPSLDLSPLSLLAFFSQIFSLSSLRSFPPLSLLRSFLPFPLYGHCPQIFSLSSLRSFPPFPCSDPFPPFPPKAFPPLRSSPFSSLRSFATFPC